MNSDFKVGDLLLYYNIEVVYVVILDEIGRDYFTVVTSIIGDYEYGYKINIKNLTTKYFLRLDKNVSLTKGSWETYNTTLETQQPLMLDFLVQNEVNNALL